MSDVTPSRDDYWRVRRFPLLLASLLWGSMVVRAIRDSHGVLGPITEWPSLGVGLVAAAVAGGLTAATDRKLLPAVLVALLIGYGAAGVAFSLR
ncbi:hypothetical protein [Streptomyces carminius]|nr:hypothetical protein [Streptomyces carminius]